MSLYGYLKKTEPDWFLLWQWQLKEWWENHQGKRIVSYLLVTLGVFLIGNGVLPIINYQIRYAPRFTPIHSPLSEEGKRFLFGSARRALAEEGERDYTLISSWFANQERKVSFSSQERLIYYNLSIPKLRINNALVQYGGEDLKKAMVQYPETALPGQFGNTVIFCHSVLPQFFDPTNYLTICSTLYKLKKGDEIFLFWDGVEYRYLVEKLFEVSPNDLSVLEQRFDGKYLSLITCTPPGTYLRRLVVRARLADF